MNKFKEISKEQMKNTKGGGTPLFLFCHRVVEYIDVNGDGKLDKVVSKYNYEGELRRKRIIYG